MDFSYTVKRTGRSTVSISVNADLTVTVAAPLYATDEVIRAIVDEKSEWIRSKLKEFSARRPVERHIVKPGDTLLYRGREYPVVGIMEERVGFSGEEFRIYEALDDDSINENLADLFKKLARRDLPPRTEAMAKRLGLKPMAVKINSAKTRWGSCSGRDSINFSWRLIMADDRAIDYVIAHELTHISVKNHSKAFWAKLEAVMPDYKEREAMLKKLSEYQLKHGFYDI